MHMSVSVPQCFCHVGIIIHSFYIALFSALEQTQCAHVACDSE